VHLEIYSNGVKDSGAFLENRAAGLRTVMIRDKQDNNDFTNYSWGYQVLSSALSLNSFFFFIIPA
jgi:hypothetical protein